MYKTTNGEQSPNKTEQNCDAKDSISVQTQLPNSISSQVLNKISGPFLNLRNLPWKTEENVAASQFPTVYMRLFKIRLTGLVVATAMAGYGLASGPFSLGSFLLCTVGTGLLSCSANGTNQFLEVPYDSQMKRTQGRPLVQGLISPLHALTLAAGTGLSGFSILFWGLNPLTAGLGLANLLLYTGIYTPMKRYSVGCTWAGAVVGAIPPLMGWAACTGTLGPESWVLAAILFAWQFPHFNGLSWNLRSEYSRAGYRVMCVTDPGLCRRTTLRYSYALLGLCSVGAPLSGLTTELFSLTSLPLNLWLILLSHKFNSDPDSKSSRKLFGLSLLYLPALMVLMFAHRPNWKSNKATSHHSQPDKQTLAQLIPT